MYISKIYRYKDSYLSRKFKKYNLSSGSFSYLLTLSRNEGISQIQISKEVGNDRAMSARTINKLIEQGFIYKVQDENDGRAYKLYLTDKGKQILPFIQKEIQEVIDFLTRDLTEDEKEITINSLKNIFEKSKILRNGENILW